MKDDVLPFPKQDFEALSKTAQSMTNLYKVDYVKSNNLSFQFWADESWDQAIANVYTEVN
jgi:hypothetical protein